MNDDDYYTFMVENKYINEPNATQSHKANVLECPICYNENELHVINPCGHMCCKGCKIKIDKCCICRGKIISFIQIRFP